MRFFFLSLQWRLAKLLWKIPSTPVRAEALKKRRPKVWELLHLEPGFDKKRKLIALFKNKE